MNVVCLFGARLCLSTLCCAPRQVAARNLCLCSVGVTWHVNSSVHFAEVMADKDAANCHVLKLQRFTSHDFVYRLDRLVFCGHLTCSLLKQSIYVNVS